MVERHALFFVVIAFTILLASADDMLYLTIRCATLDETLCTTRQKDYLSIFASLYHPPLLLIELDVVGREQARLAAVVAEPPVVVGEFLNLKVSLVS